MTKNIKKTTALLTVFAISVSLLSGCGSGDKSETPMNSNNFLTADNAEENYEAVQSIPTEENAEEYNKIKESGFKSVTSNPLSTFSVDVDTASYANIRRMIENGEEVNPDAVRIEEMINYFDYDYLTPQENDSNPIAVTTELAACPWNSDTKLLMVGMKAKELKREERKQSNIVFLIDVSGSMYDSDKLPLVQKAFSLLTENLDENDRISIVTYAGSDEIVLDGAKGNERDAIMNAVNSLEAGGSTAGAAGINTAYEIAEKYYLDNGNNRIILATDGDLNVGLSSEEELKDLIEEKRESGVYLSVLGFGTGNLKDDRLEALADNGNGNYSYIDSEKEAEKVLVDEMSGTLFTVAKDVKIQVEFNPQYVSSYRLIGYENRALADEDFTDDKKDAGDVGAGHTVTALYELELAGADNTTTLKYQQSEETSAAESNSDGEYLTVSVRYKEPDGDESKLSAYPVTKEAYLEEMSENMNFAVSVAEFGMLLRGSEYSCDMTKKDILNQLNKYDYSADKYKSEFISLVKASQIR